jgi:tetratricopeptide (TPR) repeat protein
MSELSVQSWRMPAADLGPANPLPPLFRRKIPEFEHISGIPEEILENVAYGHVPNLLPYTLQDGYTRRLHPREFRVAVLENEILRATFLLEFGGRLWSLLHKPSGHELLEVNPVFQLANLAIRNAWFSGGAEVNIATTGHSPLTCSPMFAGRLERQDGTPVLRLYEWERFRRVAYQVDAYLPDDSPLLFLRVRITNPNERDVPMYWWSNIAVPQKSHTRVIVPARAAYCLGCRRGSFVRVPVPNFSGVDFTYPSNLAHAADYFFDIPAGQRPWIAALDSEGKGLVQVSTSRMMGRKLWAWGTGPGGTNWQKFLSPPGEGYIEIQAGLATTQLEHLRMPAGANWSWLEAYGLLEADARIVHGSDWGQAVQHVEKELQHLLPYTEIMREHELGAEYANSPPLEMLQHGSGWGALERRRREASGEPLLCTPGLIFGDDSLGAEQAPWISLLEDRSFPDSDPHTAPRSFVVGEKWQSLLESALQSGHGDNWLALFHLGVMRYWCGDVHGARGAWERSLERVWTPWAARNLAVLAWEQGRLDEAAGLLTRALRAAPDLLPLAIESGRCLLEAGRAQEWLELSEELPSLIRSTGRIRLLQAQAALAEDKLATVAQFFEDKVSIDDLREGENLLTDLWFGYHARRVSLEENVPVSSSLKRRIREEYPLPEEFDFCMTAGDAIGE